MAEAPRDVAERIIRAHENMPTERGVPLGWVDPSALALARAAQELERDVIAEWERARMLDGDEDVSDPDARPLLEYRHGGYVDGLSFVLGLLGWDVPMLREHNLQRLCPCGHAASKHPTVWHVAGDCSTACTVEGCSCRDWDGPDDPDVA